MPRYHNLSKATKKLLDSANVPQNITNTIENPLLYSRFEPIIPVKYYSNDEAPIKKNNGQSYQSSEKLHPYYNEIKNLNWKDETKPEGKLYMYKPKPPRKYSKLVPKNIKWIHNVNVLNKFIENVLDYSEVAIDLEHHSMFSFWGFTCLIQISTEDNNYIIDPLKFKKNELTELNRITTNPGILKVFHGARNDVIWLQQDFSIYVVNLFDTAEAARILNIPGGCSLANLLYYYCKIANTNKKKYQLADWRCRPLPQDMINYAASDTHYLLHIYDCLKNNLIQNNLVMSLFQASQSITLNVFLAKPKNYLSLAQKLIAKQLKSYCLSDHIKTIAKLKLLLEWRDLIAMKVDDTPSLVISNQDLFRIAAFDETSTKNLEKVVKCYIDDRIVSREVMIDIINYAVNEEHMDKIKNLLNLDTVNQDTKITYTDSKFDDTNYQLKEPFEELSINLDTVKSGIDHVVSRPTNIELEARSRINKKLMSIDFNQSSKFSSLPDKVNIKIATSNQSHSSGVKFQSTTKNKSLSKKEEAKEDFIKSKPLCSDTNMRKSLNLKTYMALT